MSAPEWPLTEEWAIGRDTYNWTLYRKTGKRWAGKGYYASVEQLLAAFHRKLSRTMPAETELAQHIEVCLQVAEAAFQRVQRLIGAEARKKAEARPVHAATHPEIANRSLP